MKWTLLIDLSQQKVPITYSFVFYVLKIKGHWSLWIVSKCDTVFHDIYGYFHKISIAGNKSIEVRKLRLINKLIAVLKKRIGFNHSLCKKSLLILQKLERHVFRKIFVWICKIKVISFPFGNSVSSFTTVQSIKS